MAVDLRADNLLPDSPAMLSKRRWLYRIATLVLTVILGLGVVDVLGWWHAYGVASASVSASGGGYDLTVRYGAVSRPALATPFEIVVTRADGFDGPLTIAVDHRYLAMWDLNGMVPAPSGERVNGDWVEWEFDPPDGTTFTFVYDGRVEPAQQTSRDGAVAVVDDGQVAVEVEFTTQVRP